LNGGASVRAGGGAIIRAAVLVAVALAAVNATGSSAQSFPVKPVRVVVPLVPGGNLDIVARAVSQRLAEAFGQLFMVENRPGASSLVGTQYVAKSAPDGYTLLAIANTFTAVPSVIASPGYDPLRDFTGVSMTCKVAQVLVVTPTLPVRTVRERVALAKARPGELSYASSGNGATGHFAAELFKWPAGARGRAPRSAVPAASGDRQSRRCARAAQQFSRAGGGTHCERFPGRVHCLHPLRGGGERDARPQRWHQSAVSACSASHGD
jgi:tripartite-type tricarboxylate transporter receptor subunit TctC